MTPPSPLLVPLPLQLCVSCRPARSTRGDEVELSAGKKGRPLFRSQLSFPLQTLATDRLFPPPLAPPLDSFLGHVSRGKYASCQLSCHFVNIVVVLSDQKQPVRRNDVFGFLSLFIYNASIQPGLIFVFVFLNLSKANLLCCTTTAGGINPSNDVKASLISAIWKNDGPHKPPWEVGGCKAAARVNVVLIVASSITAGVLFYRRQKHHCHPAGRCQRQRNKLAPQRGFGHFWLCARSLLCFICAENYQKMAMPGKSSSTICSWMINKLCGPVF